MYLSYNDESDGQGEPETVDEERASKILAEEQLEIEVDLGLGGGFEARYFTCDFSYDYVRYIPRSSLS
jgi:glutamate N-acetyltransferase / amino-acid N-acetyltransferase